MLRLRTKKNRILALYLISVLIIILVYSFIYQWLMGSLEGRPRGFFHALQIIVESMTTVGYGEDAPWETPYLNLFMILVQGSGILALFMVLPLFVLPWINEKLEPRVPSRSPRHLSNHIIICSYSPLVETLVEELENRNMPFLVVEKRKDMATELFKQGRPVIYGDPNSVDVLKNARLEAALALIANDRDEENATILLTAVSLLDQLEGEKSAKLLCIVSNPANRKRIRYAGADLVVSPLELLATSLANKATGGITGKLANITHINEDLNIVELPVLGGSSLAGRTLGESQVGRRSGAKIIGVWTNGEFISDPGPGTLIDEHSVLVASGGNQELDNLRKLTLAGERPVKFPRTALIAGFNQVGKKVCESLKAEDITPKIISTQSESGVDVVGNPAEEEVLRKAGIKQADTLIITLQDDVDSLFTALLARNLNPEIQIVAQATSEGMVNKMYRAGADYVLSVAMVVGRMAARMLLGEEVIDYNKRIRIIKSSLPAEFVGKNLAQIKLRKETGCTVLAVKREGKTYPDIGAHFDFKESDEIIISGSDQNVRKLYQKYPSIKPEV